MPKPVAPATMLTCPWSTTGLVLLMLASEQLVNAEYEFRFRVMFDNNAVGNVGAVFRYKNDKNYYKFDWSTDGGCATLWLVKDSDQTILASSSLALGANQKSDVRIRCSGDELQVTVDGKLLLSATDKTYDSGGVGKARARAQASSSC